MAYIIIRIEPKDNETLPVRDREPIIARLHARWALSKGDVHPDYMPAVKVLAAKHGYEIAGVLYGKKREWPYTGYVYISQNKEGVGRVASTLHRLPVRSVEVTP